MQIDRTTLDRLLSLDDTTLARTITTLAAAAGIDQRSAQAAISDLRLVRQSLSNATDADIGKAIDMLGEDRVRAMLSALGRISWQTSIYKQSCASCSPTRPRCRGL